MPFLNTLTSNIERMKKNVKIIIACIINFLIIAALCWILEYRQKRADKELREQFNQIALQYAPAERDTIRDSVKVITQKVLMMPQEEYKLTASDQALLKDINLKVNQVVADQRTSIFTSDSVKAEHVENIYRYSDTWIDFKLNTADSILTYKARDSLQTIIARQYKHRFLFWKWGTRGYQVKVINFNPHSTLLYNNYIQVTE